MIKNVAGQEINFQAIKTSDGSAVTTGTPVIKVVKDGGTMATGTGTTTHKGDGVWHYAPVQAETNANHVSFTFTLTDAFNQTINVYVSSIDYTDAAAVLDAAGVRTALGMASADLDTQLDAIVADTGELQTDWEDGGRLDLILDGAGGGGGPTAAAIADAVWDEAQAGHTTAGTFGLYVDAAISGITAGSGLDAAGVRTALGLASANLDTQLSTIDNEIATIDTEVGAIQTDVTAVLADTNELQGDWVDGGRLDLILDGAGGTGLNAADTRAALGLASANLDTLLGAGQTVYPIDDNKDGGIPGIHSAMLKTGSSAQTFVNTQTIDSTYQVLADDGDIDWLYLLNVGGGNTLVALTFTGIATSTHVHTFKAYDFVNSTWDTIFNHTGTGSIATETAALSSDYIGTAFSESGNVYIRVESVSGGDLSVDAVAVTFNQVRLDQVGVRQAVGMTDNNLDTQLSTIDTEVGLIQVDVTDILLDTSTTIPATLTTIDTVVDTILLDTGELQTDWVNGGRLDNLLDSAVSGGAPTAASIADAVWNEAQADHVSAGSFGALSTEIADILIDTSSTIPSAIPSAAAIADAVWDEVMSGHVTAGTAGKDLADAAAGGGLDAAGVRTAIGLATANLDTQLSTIDNEIATIDTEVGLIQVDATAILADTGSLQTEWADGGRLDLILDTAALGGSGGLDAAGMRTALGLASANLDTQLSTIDTEVGLIQVDATAILADTGSLQTEWADGGRLDLILDTAALGGSGGLDAAGMRTALGMATANLDTQLSDIDTEVGLIQVDITDILADTNELQTDWTDAGRLDALLDTAAAGGGLDAAAVRAAIGLASANLDTQLSDIDTVVDDILVDTSTTIPATITTIDTVVDAILVDTGTTIPGTITTIDTEVGLMQLDVDAILVDTSTSIPGTITTIDTVVDAVLVDTTAILLDTSTTIPATITTIDTEVGTVLTATTDTAIRAAVGLAAADIDTQFSTLGGNIGSGANTVTFTVQEDVGSAPLQNSSVRATAGATSILGTTDANGQVTFALDSATWTINATSNGYSSLVNQSLVVSGAATVTYQLTLTSTIPAPATPNVATGILTAFDEEGQVEEGVVFSVALSRGPNLAGQSHDAAGRTFTSDVTGLVTCTNLIRFAAYTISRSGGTSQTFTVPDAASFTIPVTGLIGFETP